MIRVAGIFVIALALLGAGSAQALTLEQMGGTFAEPTYVTSDPGDASRLFVVERRGTIQLVQNGVKSKFADLSAEVGCGSSCAGERGLMSIALSPDFEGDGRLYVDYASDSDGKIHVEELTAFPDRQSADPTTLTPLLPIDHPGVVDNYGGQLQIGPDGALYISTGDGSVQNDELHHAQDPSSPLGKVLRLELSPPGPAVVWSYGLHDPLRFSFDRVTGDMVIGDVGQDAREEVDFAPSPFRGVVGGANANYGWSCEEGLLPGPATDPRCALAPADAYIPPAFDYPHTPDPDLGGNNRCSIVGGYVVRDPDLGALYGHYVYTDLCSGGIRALRLPATAGPQASDDCSLGLALDNPVSFGEDAARRLYVVEKGGRVYRFAGLPPASCPAPLPLPPTGGESSQPRAKPTIVGIKAQRRRVERGKAALLTVYVSPCEGRKGDPVVLLRNGHRHGSRALSRACTTRFSSRLRRNATFAAVTHEQDGYLAGESRQLKVRIAPPRQHRHHRR